jgi:phosphate starvation-inducible PhoH-like protein
VASNITDGLGGQPLSGVVQTTDGPVFMGDLRGAAWVLSAAGSATPLAQIVELGEQPIFRVSLSDGTSVETTQKHPWRILSRGWERTVDTHWLLTHKLERDTGWEYRLPSAGPAEYADADLPLDPYMLGALLGDGSFREHGSATLTSMDPAVIKRVGENLPNGDSLTVRTDPRSDGQLVVGYVRGPGRGARSTTRVALEALGLWGLRSEQKFIPDSYLSGSVAQREALCQGLMDTDGFTPTRTNSIVFGTSSPSLRDTFTKLVWSLGGTATWRSRIPTYQGGTGLEHYTGTICFPNSLRPYHGKRADALGPRSFGLPRRYVTSVEPVGVARARAIELASCTPLYLAGEALIVMHGLPVNCGH